MFNNKERDKMVKKEKAITSDLFEIETCDDCNGTGQVDTTPKGATYERLEDCDVCNGSGAI